MAPSAVRSGRLIASPGLRRFGGWLAIVAVLLQLALSFGHVHADAFAGRPGTPASVTAPLDGPPDDEGAPGHDVALCPVCVVMAMVATALVLVAALLFPLRRALLPPLPSDAAPAARRPASRPPARAPPLLLAA